MRIFASMLTVLAVTIFSAPIAAQAGSDIGATCYTACERSTQSNPEFKACLARAADDADRKLNEAYQRLKVAIRAAGKDMEQSADEQLGALVRAQKAWIAYRDENCTFEDELAFGGTAIGGNYSACICALSHERIEDFSRINRHLLSGG
ncbi:MAG TPA: lysozyme inhibitor LprI family protein [Methyloceanibacter sp.]|nr:lysozyme inhibitor LprI family protein [Methyloceanibacter sp.]